MNKPIILGCGSLCPPDKFALATGPPCNLYIPWASVNSTIISMDIMQCFYLHVVLSLDLHIELSVKLFQWRKLHFEQFSNPSQALNTPKKMTSKKYPTLPILWRSLTTTKLTFSLWLSIKDTLQNIWHTNDKLS